MGGKLTKAEIDSISTQTSFNKAEIEKLYEEFKKADTDKNGTFDKNEFVKFFQPRLPTFPASQLLDLFEAFDTDKSGSLDFKEITVALSIIGKGDATDKLTVLFDLYDKDNSGTLEKTEVQALINLMISVGKSMGKKEEDIGRFVTKLMEKIDADKSGAITRSEWITEGAKSPSLLTLLGL
ncbi:hypothetical protein CYY_002041 [Polysphondylium violaceum]|uniref:EF-hand domain-containing protein n=1 Tax=Polysphondylium violaceum TaxID=133409 RepID=A0A8J4PZ46_9MYCE|nr:hypothetical protein CYY_002041 [Polysphondylium violaceum]